MFGTFMLKLSLSCSQCVMVSTTMTMDLHGMCYAQKLGTLKTRTFCDACGRELVHVWIHGGKQR